MYGRIWTLPDCNCLVGSGLVITIANVYANDLWTGFEILEKERLVDEKTLVLALPCLKRVHSTKALSKPRCKLRPKEQLTE